MKKRKTPKASQQKKNYLVVLKSIVFSLIAIINLLAISDYCYGEDWYSRLESIDSVRSTDPQTFSLKLKDIEPFIHTFNQSEKDYFSYLKGYELTYQGLLSEALVIQEKLAFDSVDSKTKLRALITVINISAVKRDWNKGLAALNTLVDVEREIHDEKLSSLAIGVASVFYNQLGQYELGLQFSNRLAKDHSDVRSVCVASINKFEALLNLDIVENRVLLSYELAVENCRVAGEKVISANIYRLYGKHLLETLNQAQTAHELLKQHENLVLSAGYAPVTVIYQSLQAKAYWQLGMSEPAFELAQAVSQSPAAANTLEALIRANKVLFDYHSANGNSEAALAAYIKYAEADKAYLDEVKTKTLAFQLAQHQTLEQQNKISLLDEQNKLLTVQRQLDRAEQYNSRIMIAVMFCVILGMGTWGWNSFRSQRRLKQLAEYDSLTGLFSRGHFTNVAESALNHAFKLNAPASCVLFDVDRFKGINDKYGHSTGDWALKQVAALCRNQLREFEVFGRIGGEEFCLILPKCDREHALQIAEKLRSTLANCKTSACGYDFALTASFGVTDSSLAGYSMDSLLAQADRAMYKAKHTGRNRVCTYCPIEDGEVESASQQSPLTAS